jgi:hypothetical protein
MVGKFDIKNSVNKMKTVVSEGNELVRCKPVFYNKLIEQ